MSSEWEVAERKTTFIYDLNIGKRISKTIRISRLLYLPGLLLMLWLYSILKIYDHPDYTWLTPLKLVWLLGLITLFTALIALTFSLEDWVRVNEPKGGMRGKVIFQVTTKGQNVDAVVRGVYSVLIWAGKYLYDFEVWVVTDEGANLDFLASRRVRVIYTPKTYSTPNGTKYKARALNYACELRKTLGLNRSDVWVYFMDEESVVGEDTIVSIVDFVTSNKGEIGRGLILYPNFWGRSLLVSLADSIRPAQDLFFSTVETKLGKVLWMHGSHLLVRADVEAKICWDFGVTWGEDSQFGVKAVERGFRVSWLRGVLYEQSPFSLRDYFKQRRRWFFYTFSSLRGDLPLWTRLYYWISVVGWLAGFPSFLISLLNLLIPSANPFPYFGFVSVAILYNVIFWYLVGLKLNLDPLNLGSRKTVNLMLLGLVLLPLYAVLESLTAWYALLTWRKRHRVGFEVVKK